MTLRIPSAFEEINDQNDLGFGIVDFACLSTYSNNDLESKLEDFVESFRNSKSLDASDVDGILNDIFYTAINDMAAVPDTCKDLVFTLLLNLTKICIGSVCDSSSPNAKLAAKKVYYYFASFCVKAEKISASSLDADGEVGKSGRTKGKTKKAVSKNSFPWQEMRAVAIEGLLSIVKSRLSALWHMGIVEENFLKTLWAYCLKLLEDRPSGIAGIGHKESAARKNCISVVSHAVSHFGRSESSGSFMALTAALVDSILKHDHMPAIVADICSKDKTNQLTAELLTEMCHMNLSTLSSTGLKNAAAFIESFAEEKPDILCQMMPILLPQLDAGAHQIRSSIIHAMGSIVGHVHRTVVNQNGDSEPEPKIKAEGDDEEAADEEQQDESKDPVRNVTSLLRLRDSLLDMLVERVHDVNNYTRATVLKVWTGLLDNGSVPVKRYGAVGEIGVDRLFDKNAGVRKNAAALLTNLLDNNPFAGNLDSALFKAQKEEISKELSERVRSMHKVSNPEAYATSAPSKVLSTVFEGEEDEEAEEIAPAQQEEPDLDDFADSDEVRQDATVMDLKSKLHYCNSVVELTSAVESAIGRMKELLHSKNNSDVAEALRFFTRAIKFNISGAMAAFKSGFFLIWHQDAAIRNELLGAFKCVYLTDGAEEARSLAPAEIAVNLTKLVQLCDDSENTSLEKIIGDLFTENAQEKKSVQYLDDDVIDALWGILLQSSKSDAARRKSKQPDAAAEKEGSELGSTIRVISMIARCTPELLSPSRVRLLVQLGLNSRVMRIGDFVTIKSTLVCLQTTPSLMTATVKSKSYLGSALQTALMEAVPSIGTILLGDHFDGEAATRAWFSICEEAMHALFHIHPSPDKVIVRVVQHLYGRVAGANGSHSDGKILCSVYTLAKLLLVLGQTALCGMVFAENIASFAKKYGSSVAPSRGGSDEAKEAKVIDDTVGADAMEEEMGTAAAADADHERLLNHVIEQELVIKSVLGKFLPMICFIVANEQGVYSHELVREASATALCRYMATSTLVCEPNLPLLFTVLERPTTSIKVRTTIIIALGDLAFRFPNSIEPWTDRMYSRLRDDHAEVRHNTLMVITHLVLNDMIKVKGQVSHVAKSLNDPEEPIREMARLFFIKLSERSNNPVYNLLGDVISIFSQETTESDSGESKANPLSLSEEEFQSTMHFMLSFVKKDKQADTLFERLLIRLSMAVGLKQRRYIAFCISELTVTEKGIKKMIEIFKNIKDALYDQAVFDYVRSAIVKAKKTARAPAAANTGDSAPAASSADIKSIMEEVESLMEQVRCRVNGEAVEEGDSAPLSAELMDDEEKPKKGTKKPSKKPAAKPKAAAKKKGKKSKRDDSDDEPDENDDFNQEPDYHSAEEAAPPIKTEVASKRNRGKRTNRVVVDDEDDDA